MESARQAYIPAETDLEGVQPPPLVSDDADIQAQFEQFLSDTKEGQADIQIRVHRVPTDSRNNPISNGKLEYLFSAPVDMYTFDELIEKVKSEYIYPNENGIVVRMICSRPRTAGVLFNRTTTIRKGTKEISHAQEAKESQTTLLTAVEKMMAAQRAETQALMREMMGNRPQSDPMQQLGALLQGLGPFIQAITGAGRPGGGLSSVKEGLEVIALAKGLAPEGGSGDDGTMGAVTAGIKILPDLLAVLKNAQANPAPAGTPALPAPVKPPAPAAAPIPARAVPVTPGAAPVQPPTENPVFMELHKNLTDLAGLISVNPAMDPKAVADMTAAQLPQELPMDLTMLLFQREGAPRDLNDPEGFARLEMIAPKIAEHREWFQKWYAEMQAIYFETDD